MRSENILDSQYKNDFNSYLEANEALVWLGKPKPSFNIVALEVSSANFFSWLMLMIIAGAFLSGNEIAKIVAAIGCLILAISPDLIKYKRLFSTSYAISNKRLYFKSWSFGGTSINSIPLDNIKNIASNLENDTKGTLYFMANDPVDFCTYDFSNNKKQHFPTFENIMNVKEVREMIYSVRREYKKPIA